MDAPTNEILNLWKTNLIELEKKEKSIKSKIKEYESLLSNLEVCSSEKLIYIGEGYFCYKSPKETKEYLNRQILHMKNSLGLIGEEIKRFSSILKNISSYMEVSSASNKKSSEDPEFVEIMEEIDEEGNILSVKINSEEVDMSSIENKSRDEVLKASFDSNSLEDLKSDTDISLGTSKDWPPLKKDDKPKVELNVQENEANVYITNRDECNHWTPEEDQKTTTTKVIPLSNSNSDGSSEMNRTKRKEISHKAEKELREKEIFAVHIDELLDEMYVERPEISSNSKELNKVAQMVEDLKISDSEKNNLREILHSSDESRSAQVDIENGFSGNKSASNNPKNDFSSLAVKQDELLQLEILADDIDDDGDISLDEDENWDFDFDEEENENIYSSEEDYADEILYGGKKSKILPEDSAHGNQHHKRNSEAFWSLIAKNRNERQSSMNSTKEPRKPQVRFKEEVEVKEIENISEEIRNISYEKKTSKFKQSLLAKNITSLKDREVEGYSIQPVLHDVVENVLDTDTNDMRILADIQEHIEEMPCSPAKYPKDSSRGGNTSKPTIHGKSEQNVIDSQRFVSSPLPKKQNISQEIRMKSIAQKGSAETLNIGDSNLSDQDAVGAYDIEESKIGSSGTKAVDINFLELGNDLDAMAEAYNLGLYDSDIETEGPVINELDDFEKINQILNSRRKEKPDNELNSGKESDSPASDNIADKEISDDDGILLDVIENIRPDYEELEDTIVEREVRDEYHKLKRNLNSKKIEPYQQDTSELIPIDENGDVVKVSRFKASRLK